MQHKIEAQLSIRGRRTTKTLWTADNLNDPAVWDKLEAEAKRLGGPEAQVIRLVEREAK